MERLAIASPLAAQRKLVASPSAIATSPHAASPLAMRRGMRGPATLNSDHLKQHRAALSGAAGSPGTPSSPATARPATTGTGRRRVHYATSTNATPSPRSSRATPRTVPHVPSGPSPGARPKSTAGSDWLGHGALRSASVPPRGDDPASDAERGDDDASSSSSLSSDSEPLFRSKTAAERITEPRPGWERPWKKSRTKGIYPQVKELTTVFDGLALDFAATDERLADIIRVLKERITEHEQEDEF